MEKMVGLGILLLVVGLFALGAILHVRRSYANLVKQPEVTRIGDIPAKVSSNETVAVEGIIDCENPLTSKLGQEACVYYDLKIDRFVEDGLAPLDDEVRSVAFNVKDESGSIKVILGQNIEIFDVTNFFSRTERGPEPGELEVGSIKLQVPDDMGSTSGYQFLESGILVGQPVYVVGQFFIEKGELEIREPELSKGKMIVSLTGGDHFRKSYKLTSNGGMAFAIGSIICGAGLIVYFGGGF